MFLGGCFYLNTASFFLEDDMEMEKGYRLLQCPGCPVKLKLNISAEDYGKRVEATCPKCGAVCRTTIPHPPKQQASFAGTFADLFRDFFQTPQK
jgi:uncharacterized paraquat-inducible protein A